MSAVVGKTGKRVEIPLTPDLPELLRTLTYSRVLGLRSLPKRLKGRLRREGE